MALQAAYKQFLAAPNSALLATDASLHYTTTTTSYNGATDIIKHLSTLRNQAKKKAETVLNAVEGQNAVALETETTIEFVSSGGPYLPGLDDNFLADRTVQIPITHFVTFDADGKISHARLSWDQGALLKHLEVIGKTGRNWPIRDTKEQLKFIVRNVGAQVGASAEGDVGEQLPVRSRGNSTNIMRDPHASLALFAPREDAGILPAPVVSPYAGNRPRQRSFTEILGDEPEEVTSPSKGRERAESPSKAIAPKAGAGKNFQPSRLFEEADEGAEGQADTPDKNKSPERLVRPNPVKYQHFDFADGSEPADAPQRGVSFDDKPKGKHDSTWSFDDFVTPSKPAARNLPRAQDVRHWGTENDEVSEPLAKKTNAPKPRRDAEPHFEFKDDGLPEGEPRVAGHPRGTAHNNGLGLYDNNLYNEDGSEPTPGPRALGNITNLKDRRKDFESHFAMTDDSSPAGGDNTPKASFKVSDDRMKAVKMMESSWGASDESPVSQKENSNPGRRVAGPDERGIVIAGDGMGGKKGAGRAWAIGDDSDEDRSGAVPGKKQGAGPKDSNFWDF